MTVYNRVVYLKIDEHENRIEINNMFRNIKNEYEYSFSEVNWNPDVIKVEYSHPAISVMVYWMRVNNLCEVIILDESGTFLYEHCCNVCVKKETCNEDPYTRILYEVNSDGAAPSHSNASRNQNSKNRCEKFELPNKYRIPTIINEVENVQ